MERRANGRVAKRGLGCIGSMPAVVANISRGGVQLLVPQPPGRRRVALHLHIGRLILDCRGEVVWIRKPAVQGQPLRLGIVIRDAPAEFRRLFGEA